MESNIVKTQTFNFTTHFFYVVPNSHFWTDINQILEWLKAHKMREKTIDIEFLRIGLENTLKNGYNIRKTEDIPTIP